MSILTALAIYLGDHSDLKHRMKEASRTIKLEEIRSDSYLCEETVRSLRKWKLKDDSRKRSK